MSRWYCGMALGGTTPDSSTTDGTMVDALSSVTMSPESMVSTGFTVARKYPMCTVCGLGISVCSAAPAEVASKIAQAATLDAHMLRDRVVDVGMMQPP